MVTISILEDFSKLAGTSFYRATILGSIKEICGALVKPTPSYELGDKTHFEIDLEINGIPCSIYDWKESDDVTENTKLYYHIGTKTAEDSRTIVELLQSLGLKAEMETEEEAEARVAAMFKQFGL